MSDESQFGAAVRAYRQSAGLSVRAAAKAAGISEGRWRQIEQGYAQNGEFRIPANPKPDTAYAMAMAVGLPAEIVARTTGYPVPPGAHEDVGGWSEDQPYAARDQRVKDATLDVLLAEIALRANKENPQA